MEGLPLLMPHMGYCVHEQGVPVKLHFTEWRGAWSREVSQGGIRVYQCHLSRCPLPPVHPLSPLPSPSFLHLGQNLTMTPRLAWNLASSRLGLWSDGLPKWLCHVLIPFPSPKALLPVLCPVFPTAASLGCLTTQGSEVAGSAFLSSSVPQPQLLFEFHSFPLLACCWFPHSREVQGLLPPLTPFSSPPSGHSEKLHSKNPPCTSDALHSHPVQSSFPSGTLDCLA